MIDCVFVLPFLTTALYYLGARALITRPLWSRYPAWLDDLTSCASCAGFWYGLWLGLAAMALGIPFLGSTVWWTPGIIALASIVWTPLLADRHEASMIALGSPMSGHTPNVEA